MKLTDPNRRGLLGHGSILSLTSVATRTSPVYRGKYVLTTFLNTPPPPPLPNVPTLEESSKGATAPKTVREQLELHRSSPACAACHRVIDPPGFALENFNSVGQWRDSGDDGAPIDAAGVLADGSKVDGPVALRNAILSRPEAFVTALTERIMTYALGRGVEPSDMPVVREHREEGGAGRTTAWRLSSRDRRERAIPDADPAGAGRNRQPSRSGTSDGVYGVSHDHHEEASVPPHVPARHVRRRDGAADARCDGAGA